MARKNQILLEAVEDSEMPRQRRQEYLYALIEKHLTRITARKAVSEQAKEQYRRELRRMSDALMNAGMQSTPKRVGEEEIDFLLEEWAGHCTPKTKKWYLSIFNGYLKTNKNHVVEEMRIGWPKDSRVRVDWLSLEEAVSEIDAAQGVEKPLVHLELRLMMRRCEVRRLTMKDVQEGVLEVNGKGRYGGKWRSLAFAPETRSVFMGWSIERDELIAQAKHLDPDVRIPDEFLIYRQGAKLSAYSKSGLDDVLHRAIERAGVVRRVGHHTNRRSGARFVIEADPSNMSVLVEALGHESETQTRRYCGLTIDDMTKMHTDVSTLLERTRTDLRITGLSPRPPSARIKA